MFTCQFLTLKCIFGLSFQDSELVDLKETIDVLKSKNTEAQSIIQVALNVPDTTPKGFCLFVCLLCIHVFISMHFRLDGSQICFPSELQIDRQNSSESISSLNSITSHSSAGSLKEQEAKKKKKKSWVRTGTVLDGFILGSG